MPRQVSIALTRSANATTAAVNRKAEPATTRKLLTLPVPAEAAKNLTARYASPELGSLQVQRKACKLRFRFAHRNSQVAPGKNESAFPPSCSIVSFEALSPEISMSAAGRTRTVKEELQAYRCDRGRDHNDQPLIARQG